MINPGELHVGDRVGHPAWGSETYECVRLFDHQYFTLRLHGGSEINFNYTNHSFFITQKGVREKKKSKTGFAKWINAHGL